MRFTITRPITQNQEYNVVEVKEKMNPIEDTPVHRPLEHTDFEFTFWLGSKMFHFDSMKTLYQALEDAEAFRALKLAMQVKETSL